MQQLTSQRQGLEARAVDALKGCRHAGLRHGASGHIASGVIPELVNAGHEVFGLARSDHAVAAVEALGADAVRGDLDDLGLLDEAVIDVEPYFGLLTAFVGLDNPTSSARTRELVDWSPEHPSLLADLDEGHYFTLPTHS